jgi:hypothetical protein
MCLDSPPEPPVISECYSLHTVVCCRFGTTANLGSRCYDFETLFVEEHMAERGGVRICTQLKPRRILIVEPGTALVLSTVTITKTLGYNQP